MLESRHCLLWGVIFLVAFSCRPAAAGDVEIGATLESGADVELAVSGKSIRFSDLSQQSTEMPAYRQTVLIQAKGTAKENGTALLDALEGIDSASAAVPWLLKIEPGVFDLGTKKLQMKAHVDMEGSGQTATTITGSIDSSTLGVVCGASDSELRLLTVENTGGGANAVAVSNLGASTRITGVRAKAGGGSGLNIGVLNDQGGAPILRQVTAEAAGGTSAYGVRNRSSAVVVMSDMDAAATGATSTYAVTNSSSSPVMTDVRATASGGTYNFAVYNNFAAPVMIRVSASASGGTNAIGVYSYNGSSPDITDLTATATLATLINTGVETRDSSAVMRWVRAEAKGSGHCHGIANASSTSVTLFQVSAHASEGSNCYAVHNNDTPLKMYAVTGRALTASPSSAYGLFILGKNSSVSADHSAFIGTNSSVYKGSDATVRMGSCLLEGLVNTSEGYLCVECFDETATPLDEDCQPPPTP